ncbi:NAD(P)/FAD-dependent oxidoreductase, partial [Streptomyces microflavus]|uniref:NAD(P)/FAD-dependent oxidoreductase n=1 Tax=Streptomyces microflavus TaxID=1919 RepID=UPI0036BACA0F
MDLVVIGAGVVGAACAYYAAQAGLSVAVVDRGPVAGGTSGAGEGNLLVSDKEPGPELELARTSLRLWSDLAQVLPADIEFEAKGGLVVAEDGEQLSVLREFAAAQARSGVAVEEALSLIHNTDPTRQNVNS